MKLSVAFAMVLASSIQLFITFYKLADAALVEHDAIKHDSSAVSTAIIHLFKPYLESGGQFPFAIPRNAPGQLFKCETHYNNDVKSPHLKGMNIKVQIECHTVNHVITVHDVTEISQWVLRHISVSQSTTLGGELRSRWISFNRPFQGKFFVGQNEDTRLAMLHLTFLEHPFTHIIVHIPYDQIWNNWRFGPASSHRH